MALNKEQKTFLAAALLATCLGCTLALFAQAKEDKYIEQISLRGGEKVKMIRLGDDVTHLEGGKRWIRDGTGSSDVYLEITVAKDGSVTSAIPIKGPSDYFDEAVSLAMTWKFAPFEPGATSSRTFLESVAVLPLERRLGSPIRIPDIKDWHSLRMTLEKSGGEFIYNFTLEVHGDGTVFYNDDSNMQKWKTYYGQVSPKIVAQLFEAFRSADFFNLADDYLAIVSDTPTYKVSLIFDDKKKVVSELFGEYVGIPDAVSELEVKICELAGPAWAQGMEAEPYRNCKREGPFDGRSQWRVTLR